MWLAAGDLHAVKPQLSGIFAELRDKMEEEMVESDGEIETRNDKQTATHCEIDKRKKSIAIVVPPGEHITL